MSSVECNISRVGCALSAACDAEREKAREKRERKKEREPRNNEVNLSVTQRRVNSVSGGLAPEFETFPVTSAAKPRARCAPSGGGGGARGGGGGREESRDEGQCLHKTTRGYRLSVLDCRGVCYAGCASRGYVPCLTSCDSNSTQTLLSASAIPLSFAALLCWLSTVCPACAKTQVGGRQSLRNREWNAKWNVLLKLLQKL